ncbi:Sodium- and chloride-dependent taurine transporter [Paragonimus heterotremus]|uniref:Transporter n=1 Tax=Paragonimus heterotremus TaxID=100268 RepID=A0A8J4TF22_9TREM|nr:Sodium- and chloride-dependent taurine transporter [Paragonimus heterotremus]
MGDGSTRTVDIAASGDDKEKQPPKVFFRNSERRSMTVHDESGNEIEVTYDESAVPERGNWGGKIEFLMTCIGFAVGLGNVWRFPYLCYKNGGGAFLIPYFLMLMFLGLPLFFLEFAFGQFASLGPISVWNISPLFKGIGYAMVLVSWIFVIYYQIVVSHAMYFLMASFTSYLPWTDCSNEWNTANCYDGLNSTTNQSMLSNLTSPSEDYYYRQVLLLSSGIEDFGVPSWKLLLCLLGSWVICALVVIRGVQSLGKVSYFTAIFPYILLTILLIRSLLLPGAFQGIKFYLYPEFSRLLDPRVWVEAATQIFFSLSCCNGGLIAMSSFNKFKNNCCRDAIIVACINCATSVYAGFVIFANLGFMAHTKNTTVSAVAKSGPGLAFVVYPEALTNMPLPSLWAVLFFFMMCTLGFGSQFSVLEAVISGLQDELRQLGYTWTTVRQITFRCAICFVNFLLGIPMICGGGYYLFYLIDNFLGSYPLIFIAVAETLVICYVYGLRQFRRDIELMINERPNWYWRACWMVITPLIGIALILFLFIAADEFTVDDYHYPRWALSLGHLIASSPVVLIPSWFFYKYCREGGFILLKEFLKPVHEWGPARDEHRAEFMTMIRSHESLKRSRLNDMSASVLPTIGQNGSQLQLGFGLGGSVISGLAGTGIIDDTKFFQSKLSVAEKLTQAHTKEVLKRVASNADFNTVDPIGVLTASQTALANAAANSVAMYALGHAQPDERVHTVIEMDESTSPSPTRSRQSDKRS